MKKILLLIVLLLTVNLSAQVLRYVNPNATGGVYNGLSWTTGWRTFAEINWGALTPGSTLYLSGGVDSVVYTSGMTVGTSGTAAKRLTITVGANSPSPTGHSGKVVFNNTGITCFDIRATGAGRNYITIEGMYNGTQWIFCRNVSRGANVEDVANGIIISGLDIQNYTGQGAVMLNGATQYSIDSIIVRNCRMLSIQLAASQSDGIYMQRAGRILVHDNWVRQRNQDPAAHVDGIQAYLVDGAVAYNNFFINDSVNSFEGGGTPMIFGADGSGTKNILVYNNFLYMGGIWDPTGNQNSSWWARSYTNQNAKCWLVNNTIIVNGPRCRTAIYEYQTYAINNIMAGFNGQTMATIEESLPNSIQVDSTRNNLFYREGGNPSFAGSFTGSGGSPTGGPTYITWFTTYGGTGQIADPKLEINVGNEPNQSLLRPDLQSNSPAIDAGDDVEDIEIFVDWLNDQGFDGTGNNPHTGEWMLPKTDIYGTPRSGIWDVGAFEYSTGGWTPPDTTAVVVIDTLKNAELGSYHIGSGVLSGADSTFHIWTTTADSFRVTGGTFNTTMVSAVSGNTLYIPVVASGEYSTPVTNYVVVSGTTRSFTVTTKAFQGGGGIINGGWVSGSNNRKIYLPNGHALITRQP